MLNERLCIAEPFLLMIRKYENKLKKEPLGMRLVGIKNSWKYEKDLVIIFKPHHEKWAITRPINNKTPPVRQTV